MVCNAGALFNEKQCTSEGHEVTIASHFFGGSYLLSKLLLPNLQNAILPNNQEEKGKAKDNHDNENTNEDEYYVPRVIYVSSGGMYNTKFPTWEEATNQAPNQTYDGVMTYAYAKRGQIILAEEFAKQYPQISWLSCHPGWVDTIGVDEAFGSNGKKIFSPLRTKWEGSEGIAWLMGTRTRNKNGDFMLKNGGFYLDRKEQTKHLAGPFMTEGSFTKNSREEIEEMMDKLHEVVGI